MRSTPVNNYIKLIIYMDWKYYINNDNYEKESEIFIKKYNDNIKSIKKIKIISNKDIVQILNLLSNNSYELNQFMGITELYNKSNKKLDDNTIETKLDDVLYKKILELKEKGNINREESVFIDKEILYMENIGVGLNCNDKDKSKKQNLLVYCENLKKKILSDNNNNISNFVKYILCKHEINVRIDKDKHISFNGKHKDKMESIIIKFCSKFNTIVNNTQQHMKITDTVNKTQVLNYIQSSLNNKKWSINEVLPVLLELITKYFDLEFKIDDKFVGWNDSIILVKVFNENKIKGYVYLDLLNKKNRFVGLGESWNYPSGANIKKLPYCAIEGNFSSLSDKILSYKCIIDLFKNFGKAIHIISCDSKFGLSNVKPSIDCFMEKLFEYIICDSEIIDIFCNNNSSDVNIYVKNNHAFQVREMAINSMFDIFICSDDFTEVSKQAIKDDKIISDIYKKINKQLINCKNYDSDNINSEFIYLITKNYGFVCTKILTDIMAYNCFYLIKKNTCGAKFLMNVIEPCDKNLIDLLIDFTINYDIDLFNINRYINDVIYDSEKLSEQSNYCDEE